MLPEHTEELLRLASEHEFHESLYWNVRQDGSFHWFVQCSDTFWWGTADLEEIYPEDMELFRQCVEDLNITDEEYLVDPLFAARKRGMRPMSLWLGLRGDRSWPHSQEALEMFLACGPERDPKEEG